MKKLPLAWPVLLAALLLTSTSSLFQQFALAQIDHCNPEFEDCVIGDGTDADSDYLSDEYEMMVSHTNSTDPDTDKDGLSDYSELFTGRPYSTDPRDSDTDDDGLSDFVELVKHDTNPTAADTDYDGLWDHDEIVVGSSAYTPDSDSDGINDGQEILVGTNPIKQDSDGDSLIDSFEVVESNTDPADSDSDDDDLKDGNEYLTESAELLEPGQVYGTDPLDADTDNDGANDGLEVQLGTDPNSALTLPTTYSSLGNVITLLASSLVVFSGLLAIKGPRRFFVALILVGSVAYTGFPFIRNGSYVAEATSYDDATIAAVGDWGCTGNSNSTISAIKDAQADRVLGLGDYSYQNTMHCWHARINATSVVVWVHDKMHNPSTVALGNHENDTCACSPSQRLNTQGEQVFLSHFGLNSGQNPGRTYYSWEDKGVHYVVIDFNIDFDRSPTDSPQYTWVKNDLEKASKNQSINWIVVYFHQQMYTSSCGDCDANNVNYTSFRNTYQPLFDRNRVDLALQSHIHAYERMKPLTYDATITDSSSDSTYTDPRGQIYVTAGTGGQNLKNYNVTTAMSAKQLDQSDSAFGYLKVKITNSSKTLTGEFFKNGNTNAQDTFKIHHNERYSYHPFYTYWGNSTYHTEVADSPSLRLTTFSLATWFQTNEDYTSLTEKPIIANKGGFGSELPNENMNYGIWVNKGSVHGGKIEAGFETSSGVDYFVLSPLKYNDGRWHYAVVTYDSSTVRLYIDGVQVGTPKSASGVTPDLNNPSAFRIGKNSWNGNDNGNNRFFKGNADEVRVWNRALSAQEVADAYNSGTFNTSGQVLHRSKVDTSFSATGSNYFDIQADSPAYRLTTFSAATWFKTSTDYSQNPPYDKKRIIINKQGFGSESNGTNMNYGIWIDCGTPCGSSSNANKIQAGFEDCCDGSAGTDVFVRSPKTYNDGKWHYAVVTFDNPNNILKLYIDGIMVISTPSSLIPDTGTTFKPFRAGANSWDVTTSAEARYFTGNIDDTRLWNRVLTHSEVSDQFSLSIYSQSGLVRHESYGGE